MKRDPEQIVAEIINLLSELARLAGAPLHSSAQELLKKSALSGQKDTSGATGGVRLLVEEGQLDSPKKLSEIIELLKQQGRNYSNPTVSMGLLNLVRERVLTRFKDGEDKKWKYATRR